MFSSRREIAKAVTDAAIARQQIDDHLVECAARFKSLKETMDELASLVKRAMVAALCGLGFLVYRYLQAKGTLP